MSKTKIQARLKQHEAEYLGLKVRKNDKGRNTTRYQITEDQRTEINNYRFSGDSKKFVEVARRKNKDGEITSSTERLRSDIVKDVPEGFEVYKVVTDKTGGRQWVTSRLKEPETIFNTVNFDYFTELEKELNSIPEFKKRRTPVKREGVVALTDLHFGAYIEGLNLTPEYNITILCNKLEEAARKINRFKYSKVHIHFLGDLIESFTGLNHKNSWKGLQKGMFGVKAVKLFVELLEKHFLSLIYNLGCIKIVAGNHDRVTSDKGEDADGGAAELIAWGLELAGYDVEFNRSVLTHKVEGVNHILMHGHLWAAMKKTTQEICWMYGEKGVFNYIKMGHLHSRMKKLSAKQVTAFKVVNEDSIDCRQETLASIFTGNQHSEDGGWTTLAGFSISEYSNYSNGVDVYDISL